MATTDQDLGIPPEQRKSLSRTFLALAWVIEIAAAGVGLTIAIKRLQDGEGILPALPFFAVALMELTKIPLATVIYHTVAKQWRFRFIVALILSMAITFETFYIGFDTYQAQLEKAIKPTIDSVKEFKLKIASAQENITASTSISQKTATIDAEYKDHNTSINDKFDQKIDAYEEEKKSIDKKYEGNAKSIQGIVASLKERLADRKQKIKAENKRERTDLDNLAKERFNINESERKKSDSKINRLQSEKKRIRTNALGEKKQIRDKAKSDYQACQKTSSTNFLFSENCDPINTIAGADIEALDIEVRAVLKTIDDKIRTQNKILSGAAIGSDNKREDNIRRKSNAIIKRLESEKETINAKIAKKYAEIALVQGNYTRTDKAALKRLEKKITASNTQRAKELNEAKVVADQRRIQADSAKGDVAKSTKSANQLRLQLAPQCATLNDIVSKNQVYRLAIQFHGVDDACNLTQEQLTRTQWIWYGSLALVTSALGTTLAFAGLVIKYPPQGPSGGGMSGMVKGLLRRVNYALALLHRRLRRPKIKEVTVEKEVIKEVTKEVPVDRVVEKVVEVTKEVPVDKVVYRDVPHEVVKKILVHVPLFTQDVKAVVKDD